MPSSPNPVDSYDKSKYSDLDYFNSWYINNIDWINNNRNDEKFIELLHEVQYEYLAS